MKKIVMVVLFMFLMAGCATDKDESARKAFRSRFETVEESQNWRLVADKETGVMYVVSFGAYNRGTFTLLVDADGNPLIYDPIQKNEL